MSTTTTNYGLIKPDTTDPILIGQLNDNADAIDAALKENADAIENKPDAADIPTPSTAAPAMDGTAAAGTSTDYARADHIHPSDTSKQDTLTAAQLAAVNSGINSEKVAQIEINKNNISKDEAALVELVDGGAKNHINNTLTSGTTPSGNISYTVNSDSSITITGGTATANADIVIPFSVNNSGTYVLTGGAAGGSAVTYKGQITLYPSMSGVVEIFDDISAETTLTAGTDYAFRFRVYSGKTISDCTIYPMICTKAAWDISHEYQPYRPSYQELYEMVKALQAQLANQ